MHVHPLAHDQQLGNRNLLRTAHILLGAAGRLQQLIGIGNIAYAQRLTGRDPEGVLRRLPVRFEEHGTAQSGNHRPEAGAEFRELWLFDIDTVVVAERSGLGWLEAGVAFAWQNNGIVKQVATDVVRNRDVNGADRDLLEVGIPGAVGAGGERLLGDHHDGQVKEEVGGGSRKGGALGNGKDNEDQQLDLFSIYFTTKSQSFPPKNKTNSRFEIRVNDSWRPN